MSCTLTRSAVLHVHDEQAAEHVSVQGCAARVNMVARDGGDDERAHKQQPRICAVCSKVTHRSYWTVIIISNARKRGGSRSDGERHTCSWRPRLTFSRRRRQGESEVDRGERYLRRQSRGLRSALQPPLPPPTRPPPHPPSCRLSFYGLVNEIEIVLHHLGIWRLSTGNNARFTVESTPAHLKHVTL